MTFSFVPMVGVAIHNHPYRITIQWRYGVYMKGPRGPFQTPITINVQNLVVTSPDVGRVLRWDPERGIAETSFSYNIECAQRKVCDVCISWPYGRNAGYIKFESGKWYVHWESYNDANLNGIWDDKEPKIHFIYDPERNLLKVYHKIYGQKTATEIYIGPPENFGWIGG